MIKHKSTFFLGIFIIMLSTSFVGLPSFWKMLFLFLCGFTLTLQSIHISMPKKLHKRPAHKKEKVRPTIIENIPLHSQSPSSETENPPQI